MINHLTEEFLQEKEMNRDRRLSSLNIFSLTSDTCKYATTTKWNSKSNSWWKQPKCPQAEEPINTKTGRYHSGGWFWHRLHSTGKIRGRITLCETSWSQKDTLEDPLCETPEQPGSGQAEGCLPAEEGPGEGSCRVVGKERQFCKMRKFSVWMHLMLLNCNTSKWFRW